MELPTVDYEKHPAFAPFAKISSASDGSIDTLIEEIDSAYLRIFADILENEEARKAAFEREVMPHIERLISRSRDAVDIRRDFRGHFVQALERARDWLRHDLSFPRQTTRNSHAANLSDAQAHQLDTMHDVGFFKFTLGPELANQIVKKTRLERAVLRSRAKKSPRRHCAMSLHLQSPASNAIKEMLEKKGILDLASAYMGKPMEFMSASLEHAHTDQNWYKNCYEDLNSPTTKTVYMHLDADSGVLKAMMYLKDVTALDGPFSYVRGSHRWKRSAFAMAVRKGMDQQQGAMFAMEPDGLDYKSGYYRPLYQNHRADIISLPPQLRGSTHFGDDVQDGTELSRFLLENEEIFIAPAGTVVLFDGSMGIHRGSLVRDGSRWAVQLAFRIKQGGGQSSHASRYRAQLSYMKCAVRYLIELAR